MSLVVVRAPRIGLCASLIASILIASACNGSATPDSPTSASPVTVAATATAAPPVPDTGTRPDAVAPAPRVAAGTIASMAVQPSRIRGGETAVGTVTLAAPAPAGGTTVALTSSDRDVRPPASIAIAAGQTIGMFPIPTSEPHADTDIRLTAATIDGNATADVVLVLPAPGARGDQYTVLSNDVLVVPAPGILDNDTRRSGHELIAELDTAPMSGTLTLNGNGGFTYRPNAGFSGTDRFIYRAVDGATRSTPAHVWIAVNLPVTTPPAAAAPPADNTAAPTGSQTFSFTGSAQTFTVPTGVTRITVEASGAQGGSGFNNGGPPGAGGLGGTVKATLTVVAGATYQINIGGQGGAGNGSTDGGGGGGATDMRTGAFTLNDRVLVAGGGGGGGGGATGGSGGAGGAGGGLTGATGANSSDGDSFGGGGGTQAAGGAGGATPFNQGLAGTLGTGGNGCCNTNGGPGGTNGGAPGNTFSGGGGGGLYGGGGAGVNGPRGGGGGGGSSFTTASATSVTHQQGARSGNGVVTITW